MNMYINLKRTLKEAGRYKQVKYILKNIISTNEKSFPIYARFGDNGKILLYVNGRKVRKQAKRLLSCIKVDDYCLYHIEKFDKLQLYIDSINDIYLHNYTLEVSHRNAPDEDLMESIRCYCILWHFFNYIELEFETDAKWEIPDGWKKISGNCQ